VAGDGSEGLGGLWGTGGEMVARLNWKGNAANRIADMCGVT